MKGKKYLEELLREKMDFTDEQIDYILEDYEDIIKESDFEEAKGFDKNFEGAIELLLATELIFLDLFDQIFFTEIFNQKLIEAELFIHLGEMSHLTGIRRPITSNAMLRLVELTAETMPNQILKRQE